MAITKTGAWGRVESMLNGSKVDAELTLATGQAGELVKAKMHERFEKSGPGWAPKKQTGPGGGDKPLIDTGTMKGSIKFQRTAKHSGFVGINRQNDLTGFNVALAHELGTSRMPARPFVRPTAKECGPLVKKLYGRAVKRGLGK